MRRISTLALLLALAASLQAQRKSPVLSPVRHERLRQQPPGLLAHLPPPAGPMLGPLTSREVSLLSTVGRVPRIGVHRTAPFSPSEGAWQALANGTTVWRLSIHSTGAAGIRVQFGDFSTGAGKVWVYGEDGQAQGPYTAAGIFGNGEFWSGTAWGDTAVVEYQPADPNDRSVPFVIRAISHRAAPHTGRASAWAPSPASFAAARPWVDPAGSCNIDVSCYSDWSDAAKMVSEIVFETEEGGQQFEAACSASLVATRDNNFKPYLLTAGHCINNEADARTVETFWTYQTSKCGAPPPNMKKSATSQTGADFLTGGTLDEGDYSLLLLKDVPGGVLYSGWDAADVAMGSNLVGIHHPMGSYKRILFGHRSGDQVTLLNGYNLPPEDYYTLTLDRGIAQPGSSGSPLFSSPGVIVGTLTWGPAADGATLCSLGSFDIGYGRFSVAYPNMMNWLEDLPYSEVVPSKADLSFTGTDGSIDGSPRQTISLTTQSGNPVTFSVRSDAPWIEAFAASSTASSANPAALTIGVNAKMLTQARTYVGTVTIFSGAAPPQFVNVRVTMKVDISNVVASATPNPVKQGSDGLWSYTIQLQETAGVATHLTRLRIDGRDYTGQIAAWFGSDELAAGGTLQAPLRSKVLVAPATQTVEVGGTDDASGKTWDRVFTVSLLPPQ